MNFVDILYTSLHERFVYVINLFPDSELDCWFLMLKVTVLSCRTKSVLKNNFKIFLFHLNFCLY